MFWRMDVGDGTRRTAARMRMLALLLALLPACSSLEFTRNTETSGTFTATGWAFTIVAVDIPKGALQIARENVSDSNLANLVVEDVEVRPYLGLFDIRAKITGTWGFSGS
jgi:hypothetical protein